jgi:hypothetical protein
VGKWANPINALIPIAVANTVFFIKQGLMVMANA